jgi:hypothetical protein
MVIKNGESVRSTGRRLERHAGDRRVGSKNGLRPPGRV